MSDETAPAASSLESRRRSLLRRLAFLAPAIVVAAIAAAVMKLRPAVEPGGTIGANLGRVAPGGDYYVSLALVEVGTTKSNGKSWDGIAERAPDPRYEIIWRDTPVFRSSAKRNTLLARWSEVEVSLGALVGSRGNASADAIVQAARITIAPGEKVRFIVTDDDLLSPDAIGTFELETTELAVGEQSYAVDSSLKRIVVRVEPMRSAKR